MAQYNKHSGFTIVELLIVITIVGVLAGIVIVAYSGVQQGARNTARIHTIQAIVRSMQLYQAEYGKGSLYAMLPTGSDNTWCIGTDYQNVAPSPDFTCRYVTYASGTPTVTPVLQTIYDAIHTNSSYSMQYSPVTQTNIGTVTSVISSAPFVTRGTYSSSGLRFTIDGSPPQDYYVLLSYRLEGVDQNCRIPVVRIASQTANLRNYATDQPYSVVNGGATECWVWLEW